MKRASFIALFLTILSCSKKVEISPNEAGVIYNTDKDFIDTTRVLLLGYHFIKSNEEIILMDLSHQSHSFDFKLQSKDNQFLNISFKLFYRPNPNKVSFLYKKYQNDYSKMITEVNVEKILIQNLSEYDSYELRTINNFDKLLYTLIIQKTNFNNLIEILDVSASSLKVSE